MAKISIVIPVYNVEKFLTRCLDSVLHQTYHDFDLILIDDGSPDECPKICDEYGRKDERVRIIHQCNAGLSAARNSGIDWAISHSTSEYITFIDSDDFVSMHYLEELLKGVALGVDVACLMPFRVSQSTTTLLDSDQSDWRLLDTEEYWRTNPFCNSAWGKLYRKSMFGDIRYPIGKIHEDNYVTYRLLFNCNKIAVSSQPLYYYFYRADSITQDRWTKKRMDAIPALVAQCEYFQKRHFIVAHHVAERELMETLAFSIHKLREFPQEKTLLIESRKLLRIHVRAAQLPLFGNLFVWKMSYPWIVNPIFPYLRFIDAVRRLGWRNVLCEALRRYCHA